jgi:hypothetical protein
LLNELLFPLLTYFSGVPEEEVSAARLATEARMNEWHSAKAAAALIVGAARTRSNGRVEAWSKRSVPHDKEVPIHKTPETAAGKSIAATAKVGDFLFKLEGFSSGGAAPICSFHCDDIFSYYRA